MNKSQLLCTFTTKNKLSNTIESIKAAYEILYNKIFVLQNIENNDELVCSYNIYIDDDINPDLVPKNTINIHRKKATNTLYSINALNYLITVLNDGVLNTNYSIPWENYSNCILVTNHDEFKKIKTTIYDIIKI